MQKKLTFLRIYPLKPRGGGLKAVSDMSANEVSFFNRKKMYRVTKISVTLESVGSGDFLF